VENSNVTSGSSTHREIFQLLRTEVSKWVVGQEYLVDRLLVTLLSNGHILLEGVPGLAKTRLLTALTSCIGAKMNRIQFTPDLLPSDVIGTEVFRAQTGEFTIRTGPVFTNLLLADEINRAPAKVQSALLQAMQERQVTIGEKTFDLPRPFLVLATQNPIEQEGTYPLPEAQLDRFLMKVRVDYPSYQEEIEILAMTEQAVTREEPVLNCVLTLDALFQMRQQAIRLHVDERLDRYIVSLVQATRDPSAHRSLKGLIEWGASPRASIALKICARSLAFVRGKDFVSPEDIKDIAPEVLRHRILPGFEAEAKGVTSDDIVETLLQSVNIP
jgi:MoxR-like ATPase